MTEKETIDVINKKYYREFILTYKDDEMCRYDAVDKDFILEIKNRRKYYTEKLIEADKMFYNDTESKKQNKGHLYVVTDQKGLWIFNIGGIINKIINTPPKLIKCPITTDFKNNKKIDKYCYTLKESMASYKIEL